MGLDGNRNEMPDSHIGCNPSFAHECIRHLGNGYSVDWRHHFLHDDFHEWTRHNTYFLPVLVLVLPALRSPYQSCSLVSDARETILNLPMCLLSKLSDKL